MIEKPEDSVVVKLVVSLLQLSKMAVNHTGEKAVLGKLISPTGKLGLSLETPGRNCGCPRCYFHCASHFNISAEYEGKSREIDFFFFLMNI